MQRPREITEWIEKVRNHEIYGRLPILYLEMIEADLLETQNQLEESASCQVRQNHAYNELKRQWECSQFNLQEREKELQRCWETIQQLQQNRPLLP